VLLELSSLYKAQSPQITGFLTI